MFTPWPANLVRLIADQLTTLPLTERIETEDDKAMLREENAGLLVTGVGFAIRGMSARQQHAGKRPLPRRQIEISRDVKARKTLKQHVFNRVTLSLNAPGDLWVQRIALGQRTKNACQKIPPLLLIIRDRLRRCQRRFEFRKTSIQRITNQIPLIRAHHLVRLVRIEVSWQHAVSALGFERQGC